VCFGGNLAAVFVWGLVAADTNSTTVISRPVLSDLVVDARVRG
jgi:hypothetical protein